MTNKLTGKFRLWRKQTDGTWISRAGVYDFDVPNDVQMATHHVNRGIGWKAYDASKQRVSDKTPHIEFNWGLVDTTELDEKTDNVCYMEKLIGGKMSDFAKSLNGMFKDYTDTEREQIHDQALIKAIKKYKEGKTIPYFLKKQVLDYLANENV